MAILDVRNVKKVYITGFGGSRVQALTDVSFQAEQGEYLAIMGESGSGKTTLLNILAALDKPPSGDVLLEGKPLSAISDQALARFRRENLGFVFQDFNLLDTLSLRDNIYLPLVLSGKATPSMMAQRIAPLAERLSIAQVLDKFPYEVSGGEKQRAAIVRGEPLPDSLSLFGLPFAVSGSLPGIAPLRDYAGRGYTYYFMLMNEADIRQVIAAYGDTQNASGDPVGFDYAYAFNAGSLGNESAWRLINNTQNHWASESGQQALHTMARHYIIDKADFNALYGGLLFVSTLLGTVFVIAMVLIIYYKQVSEGYEDKENYDIMQRVGMSEREVRQSVNRQVLLVFFLPLAAAGLHTAMSYSILQSALSAARLQGGDGGSLAPVMLLTFLVFALFYVAVYMKTAGSYYRIVRRTVV